MSDTSTEPLVVTRTVGGLGRIELNKPKAINALGTEMIRLIVEALDAWKTADAVTAVLMTGRGERGLCAGGDIKAIHKSLVDGSTENLDFFDEEYAMDYEISAYPKPYIAIMNGITMGGGVGISAHGSHRIVTDSTKIGMPETTIGLFPDVGATYLLSRMPHQVGMYLAMTGLPIGAGAAIAYGLADYYVEDAQLPALIAALEQNAQAPESVIAQFAAAAPENELADSEGWIAEAFGKATPAEVVAALRANGSEAAVQTADLIETKSPRSVAVSFSMIRKAADMTLKEVLEMDFRTAVNIAKYPDLVEGIRAQVVDKDRNPKWNPATLAEVDPAEVEEIISKEHTRKVFS